MRVLIVVPSLSCGGAERNAAVLAGGLACKGWEVYLATLDAAVPDFYELAHTVRRIKLDVERATTNPVAAVLHNLEKISRLRSLIREVEPNVVVANVDRTNVTTLLAASGLRTPVACLEVSTAYNEHSVSWRQLIRWSYPSADALVSASSAVDAQFSFITARRRHVIPSALELPHSVEREREQTILFVGRLHPVKNVPLLLRGFASALRREPGWRLEVVGDGPQKDQLEEFARKLGIERQVTFRGFCSNVFEHYRKAAFLVLSSDSEGFGNVLVEAQSQGCPVISTTCGGPSDVVQHGVNGLLVPTGDVSAMRDAIQRLAQDDALRTQLSKNARLNALRFAPRSVVSRWEVLLRELTVDASNLS
jgi:glycosyltransferase involved in cell wall biosynthesis